MKDTKKSINYDPIFKTKPKTTEAELAAGWMYWNEKPNREDPFKLYDLVLTPGGYRARIVERCGMNAEGDFEYFVEPCIPTRLGGYYTEHELTYPSDTPPPVPSSSELKITKCDHKRAYENVISVNLRFWVCPDCKQEIDAPNKLS